MSTTRTTRRRTEAKASGADREVRGPATREHAGSPRKRAKRRARKPPLLARGEAAFRAASRDGGDAELIAALEQELEATRADLEGTIRELERANEALRASNEEVVAMNEELQLANEELNRSRDELRCVNDELSAVNQTLRAKVDELDAARADLASLMEATDIPTLFLDGALSIKRFTPSAARLLGLVALDVGRPFGDFTPRFKDDDLLHDARRVLAASVSAERVVESRDGRWYLRRMLPYRGSDSGRTTGVVVAFVDVTVQKTLREEVINIATLEQRRIGQELHDGTQQTLTGLGLLAQHLGEHLRARGAAREADLATKLADGIADANGDVRRLARGLVPVPLGPGGLEAALGDLVLRTEQQHGLACRLDYNAGHAAVSQIAATHLYRIVREAVTNAVKHAQPRSISIRLQSTGGALDLEVADDGKGIDEGRIGEGGVGLSIMQHRCRLLGGTLSIARRASGGTLVRCRVPHVC